MGIRLKVKSGITRVVFDGYAPSLIERLMSACCAMRNHISAPCTLTMAQVQFSIEKE